ncbi:hypothetical protein SAMN05443551_2965 [Marivita hallyeonensis]|uniref:Uncharacterized protein n=1 Tax=Marivita hallyeonensis TaxID=996342 RepID=A0A1M5VN91_9RHOB|nr:hypothetical protein SAMN05443551_2965 [Marivita hallyeonensis]
MVCVISSTTHYRIQFRYSQGSYWNGSFRFYKGQPPSQIPHPTEFAWNALSGHKEFGAINFTKYFIKFGKIVAVDTQIGNDLRVRFDIFYSEVIPEESPQSF